MPLPTLSAFRRAGRPAIAVAALLAALTGCHGEGGRMRSNDMFTYISTAHQPKTISLVDTRTGETMWSIDVPVNRQLVVDFNQGASNLEPDELYPDTMTWGVSTVGKWHSGPRNKLRVPPHDARRLDMAIRPSPEMPGAVLATRPVQDMPATYGDDSRWNIPDDADEMDSNEAAPTMDDDGDNDAN